MAPANHSKGNHRDPPFKYDVLHRWFTTASPFQRTSAQSQLQPIPPELAASGLHPAFQTFNIHQLKEPRTPGPRTPLPAILMPYNNAAIPSTDEVTGSASLPLARVKRILALDEDIHQCSNNGAFVITVATELFIRYLAEQAMNVVKSERKPRRNIQYKDIAGAVSRIDNLEFLADVIPKTTTVREYREKKTKSGKPNARLSSGQTTLDNSRPLPSRPAEVLNSAEMQAAENDISQGEPAGGPELEDIHLQAPRANGNVFHHYDPNGRPDREGSEDVEMG